MHHQGTDLPEFYPAIQAPYFAVNSSEIFVIMSQSSVRNGAAGRPAWL
jgi:hypothetical protein